MSTAPEATRSGEDSESPWPDEIVPAHAYRVLILAPIGNDARLTAEFLGTAGITAVTVPNLDDLLKKMREGCGAVLVAEEAITSRTAAALFTTLRGQPAWSDVPITLITSGGVAAEDRMRRVMTFDSNSNVSVLERPFRPATLVSAVDFALRSRRRQYEVRKLLAEVGEARDAAERANRAKDEFLAALSHELRTPLNPVLLLATEAAGDAGLAPEVRQDFEQIARNIMLEARLIDDLLDLTRVTQGKLRLDLQTIDAHDALTAALATTQPEIDEKNIAVQLDLRAGARTIHADPVRLQQILWNVLKNAAKFTPPAGSIRVETSSSENEVVIRVHDTGVGIDPAELNRIFDAFVQGNHARTRNGHRFGGLGLGLAISRRIAEMHGGRITAESDGPGHGSTFSIALPLARADTPPRPAEAPTESRRPFGTSAKRLLIVEDHAATRSSLSRLLERRGYQVTAAGSLAQARVLAAEAPFDLVISDIGLPDGSGYDLMMELGEHTGIPGIALSGYGMEGDVTQSKSAGFVAHLTKPISMRALDEALERVDLASRAALTRKTP